MEYQFFANLPEEVKEACCPGLNMTLINSDQCELKGRKIVLAIALEKMDYVRIMSATM